MSASAPIYSTTFAVGRYRCTIDFPPVPDDGNPRPQVISSRWHPEPGPEWDNLSDAEQAQYVAGRDAGAEHVAELIGGGVAVVTLGEERAAWPGAAADLPDDPQTTDGGVLTVAVYSILRGGVAVVTLGEERAAWPGAAADLPDDPQTTDGGVLTVAELMLHSMPISIRVVRGYVPEPSDLYAFGRAIEAAVLERVRVKS